MFLQLLSWEEIRFIMACSLLCQASKSYHVDDMVYMYLSALSRHGRNWLTTASHRIECYLDAQVCIDYYDKLPIKGRTCFYMILRVIIKIYNNAK